MMKPLVLLFAVAVAMLMIFACAFGQTAQVAPKTITTTAASTPVIPIVFNCPKNGGKVSVNLVPNNIPALALTVPGQAAPVTVPNFTYTITLTPDQAQALKLALTNGGGSVTGVTISLKVAQ